MARGPLNVMGQCCRKRRHSVTRLAACQFMQGLSPAFATMTAWQQSSREHSLPIDVAQSAVFLVAPVIPRSTAVKDAGVARDALLQKAKLRKSSLGKWSALLCRITHHTAPGVTVHMIVRSFGF